MPDPSRRKQNPLNLPRNLRCLNWIAGAAVLASGCTAPVQAQGTPTSTSKKQNPDVLALPTMTDAYGIDFVQLKGGQFDMGSAEFRKPVHPVRVSGFWISKYEITNVQFEKFRKHKRTAESPGDDFPVTGVSKPDAMDFAKFLSKKTGKKYRLPTDAEWEYAARGGLVGQEYPWAGPIHEYHANLGSRAAKKVGSYAPNRFGLYDMAGNASEYVLDCDIEFDPNLDGKKVSVNPVGSLNKDDWVIRGGNFLNYYGQVGLALPSHSGLRGTEYIDSGIRLIIEEDSK